MVGKALHFASLIVLLLYGPANIMFFIVLMTRYEFRWKNCVQVPRQIKISAQLWSREDKEAEAMPRAFEFLFLISSTKMSELYNAQANPAIDL